MHPEPEVPDDPTGGEVNPTTRAISLWRAEDYGTLPSPFDLYTETTYWLRDVDGQRQTQKVVQIR